jgi:hypothetical protein
MCAQQGERGVQARLDDRLLVREVQHDGVASGLTATGESRTAVTATVATLR